jgi:hypothetical protein
VAPGVAGHPEGAGSESRARRGRLLEARGPRYRALALDREDPRPRYAARAVRRELVPLLLNAIGAERGLAARVGAGHGPGTRRRANEARAAIHREAGDRQLARLLKRVQLAGAGAPPAAVRQEEDQHGRDDGRADGRARGYRNAIHIRGRRALGPDLSTLAVRDARRTRVWRLLGSHHAHNYALL